MTQPIAGDPIYRGRRFEAEIIESYVRWYITYRLSYRDLVAMMAYAALDLARLRVVQEPRHTSLEAYAANSLISEYRL